MKDSLKNLLKNNSPSRFFEDVKSTLEAKMYNAAQSVAGTVASTVFEETEQLDELSTATLKRYKERSLDQLQDPWTRKETYDKRDKGMDRAKAQIWKKSSIIGKTKNVAKKTLRKIGHGVEDAARAGLGALDRGVEHIDTGLKKADHAYHRAKRYLTKEELELNEKQNAAMLGRYRLLDKSGTVVHSHDDKQSVIAHGKKLGGHSSGYRMVDSDKMNEDVEQLDEVSKNTLQSYKKKASIDAIKQAVTGGVARHNRGSMPTADGDANIANSDRKFQNRVNGVNKATKKMEEEFELNEMRNTGTYHVLGSDGSRVYSGSYSKARSEYEKRGKGHSLSKDAHDGPVKSSKQKTDIMNDYARKIGAKSVSEDMGVNRIYTANKKSGRNVETLVVNKKRKTKAGVDNQWKKLIDKYKEKTYESVMNEENEEHYHGLKNWVSSYQTQRKAGNVKDAKQTRDNIQKMIDKHKLDAKKVWGSDPDAKA